MLPIANQEIRNLIKENNLRHWEVAHKVGVSYSTFASWLRIELPSVKKQKILRAIVELNEFRESITVKK